MVELCHNFVITIEIDWTLVVLHAKCDMTVAEIDVNV